MGICIFGQGDCNTTTSVDISYVTSNESNLNNSITNKIQQNCKLSGSQDNTINIVGSTVKKLSATQKNSLESLCILKTLLDSSIESKVTDKVLEAIKTNLESQGAMLGSPANNNTVSKNITNNKSNIDNSKFNEVAKDCILSQEQKNLLNIIGSNVEDTTTDQANASFLKCLSEHSDTTKVTNEMLKDTTHTSDNTSKAEGGDLGKSVGDAAKGVGEGVSTGAKGIGEGVSTGAKGLGEAGSSVIGAYMWPIAIISGVLFLSIAIVSIVLLMNNDIGSISEAGTSAVNSIKPIPKW
jgi:hypothetical protein